MLDQPTLKAKLRELDALPTLAEAETYLSSMLTHIGTSDPELRDELIYRTFAHWISEGVFDTTTLQRILSIALDIKHLFLQVGARASDSVFTRTFSVLLVPLVLHYHQNYPFLRAEDLRHVKTALRRYLEQENDLRGYVSGKGWAHAVAHAADALDALAGCEALGREDLLELLGIVHTKVSEVRTVYTHGEDERLVNPVITILKRDSLSSEDLLTWLKAFETLAQEVGSLDLPEGYRGFINLKHYLRTLYFSVLQVEDDLPQRDLVLSEVENLLKAFSEL